MFRNITLLTHFLRQSFFLLPTYLTESKNFHGHCILNIINSYILWSCENENEPDVNFHFHTRPERYRTETMKCSSRKIWAVLSLIRRCDNRAGGTIFSRVVIRVCHYGESQNTSSSLLVYGSFMSQFGFSVSIRIYLYY